MSDSEVRNVDVVSYRRSHLALLALLLLGCGLAVLGYGLYLTPVWKQEIWPKNEVVHNNLQNFALFITAAAALMLAVFRRSWPAATAVGIVLALMAVFGFAPVIAVSYVILSCLCLGHMVLVRYGRRFEEDAAEVIFNILVGFAILACILNVTVHFRINKPMVFAMGLALPIVGCRRQWVVWGSQLGAFLAPRPVRLTHALFAVVLLLIVAAHAVYAALPERYWDAMAMHVTISSTMRAWGYWPFDSAHFAPAVMPMNADLFYAVVYQLGGDNAAHLLNWLFFVMTAVLLFCEIQRCAGIRYALLFTALYASTPVAFIECATLFIENVLTVFLFGSLFLLIRRWKRLEAVDLYALALLLGASCSTKLHGVLFLMVILPFLGVSMARQKGFLRLARHLPLATLLGVVVAAPPYVTAWKLTGNPVFPFLNAYFKSPQFPSESNLADLRWSGLRWQSAYDLTFHSHRHLEGLDGAMGFHFITLGLAGLVVGILRRDRTVVLAALIGVCCTVISTKTILYLRYIYPLFPLAILVCSGIGIREARRSYHLVVQTLILALIGLNLYCVPTGGHCLQDFRTDALFSDRKRQEIVDTYVPQRHLVDVLNATCGRQTRVLFLGCPYAAGLQGEWRYPYWYGYRLAADLRSSTSVEQFIGLLRREGITHVIVDQGQALAKADVVDQGLKRYGKKMLTVTWCSLYALDYNAPPSPVPSASHASQ